jgi:hypothetical protein
MDGLAWKVSSCSFFPIYSDEWVIDCCLTPIRYFVSYIIARSIYIQWSADDIHFIQDQHG